ncbi:MAG: hypothetical protein CMK70_14625 [Pseudohongiella sp.]|nr:hypothetical protein [Pseudohongiella sp.]|tara:strand:+ start:2939 stop:3229 length:291 start_codon:yes stop_codon:yes gene_type:complete
MKIIYRAADIMEAHIVAGLLRSHGIEPHVGGHYLQGAVGDLAVQGFADVYVQDDDFDAAQPVIRDYDSQAEALTQGEDADEYQADWGDPDSGISHA